jgi:hypothetical protein
MAHAFGTPTVLEPKAYQANFIIRIPFTADASYPAGGYLIDDIYDDLENVYTTRAIIGDPFYDSGGTTGYFFVYDEANDKLKIHLQATGAEASGDLSAIVDAQLVVLAE